MLLTRRARYSLTFVLAVAYGALAVAMAATMRLELFAPLSITVLFVVPFALGAITSLARAAPSRFGTPLLPAAVVLCTAAVGYGAEQQPLAWFLVVIPVWIVAASVGGLALAFVSRGTRRLVVVFATCLLPAVAGPTEARFESPEIPFVKVDSVDIAAPAREVWEHVIEVQPISAGERPASRWARLGLPVLESALLDDPRPGSARIALFAGGLIVTERVTEWEDDERFRVVAKRIAPDSLLRSASRWAAFVNSGLFTPFAASYDLVAVRNGVTRLRMTGEYRLSTSLNRYLEWWASRAVRHDQRGLLAVIRRRAESARSTPHPLLTAEMRYLRASAVQDMERLYSRFEEFQRTTASFVNGDRRVEVPDELATAGRDAAPDTEVRLRAVLRKHAASARTSMWMMTGFGAKTDSTSTPAVDSLRVEFEDWLGRCVHEVTPIAYSPRHVLAFGTPRRTRCEVGVMAERIRRGRLLATLPIRAGDLNDNWSVALAARGTVRIYMDSIVVHADSLRMRAKPLDGRPQTVDSLAVGLALGAGKTWSVSRRGTVIPVKQSLAVKEEWSRTRLRFSIPLDATFPVERAWPVFETILSVRKTTDNPYGTAWTYAHAPEGFFKDVVRKLP